MSFLDDQPDTPTDEVASTGLDAADAATDELDEHDLDDLNDDAADDGDDEGADGQGSNGAGSRAAVRASTNRLVRRVAAKAAEVASTKSETRGVAATLLGVEDNLVDLTAAIMTSGRSTLQPFQDLTKIAEADPFEAAIVAGALDATRRKRVWGLLEALGLVPDSDLPASSAKAGVNIARTVHQQNLDDINEDLVDVVELLKKA